MVDPSYPFQVDDESLPTNSALKKWTEGMMEGCKKAGRPIGTAKSNKAQVEAAGFTNVVELQYKWPQNHWPKNKKFKELGMFLSPLYFMRVFEIL